MHERKGKKHLRPIIVITTVAVASILLAFYALGLIDVSPPDDSIGGPTENGITPSRITLIHNGNEYDGELLGYVFDRTQTISELPSLNIANITSISTQNIIEVDRDETIEFVVENKPSPQAQMGSLSSTVYTTQGEPVTVLDATNSLGTNTYAVTMLEQDEQYVIISIVTWLPQEDSIEISGYAMYGYRIEVIEIT